MEEEWKQAGIMKEYRQVPAAVECSRRQECQCENQLADWGLQPLETSGRCGRSAAMVKRRTWVNIAVCPCLHSSLTPNRNIKNKVWELYIFVKKCVCSFIEVVIIVDYFSSLYLYMYTCSIQHLVIGSKVDWVLQLWLGIQSRRRKNLKSKLL